MGGILIAAGVLATHKSPAPVATQVPLSGRTGQGAVVATETPAPGATTGVNTLNPTIQVQGPFTGSASSRQPFSGTLTLREAIERGLEFNLGSVNVAQLVTQARSQRTIARSALLPNLIGNLTATREEINLAAQGLGSVPLPISGVSFPTIVGPFGFYDFRARVSQSILDLTAWNSYRAAKDSVRASELSAQDTRELVVLAVAGTYLQTVTSKARVDSARSQLDTANALLRQASHRRAVGVVAQLDVNRAQVQVLMNQQRVTSLQNDWSKQKITLARLIGLPPTDQYQLVDDVPFSPPPVVRLDDALRQALDSRADVRAATAQVQAADRALAAARAERWPSISLNADYGRIGKTPADARGTFTVVAAARVPIWEGGRTEGHVEAAEAAVAQRRAELDDLTQQVQADVRKAYLDMEAAARQVTVAERNLEVTRQNLDLTSQRFQAGVTDNVELVQAQEALAVADLDRINSLFAYSIAKLNLLRALGRAVQGLADWLKVP